MKTFIKGVTASRPSAPKLHAGDMYVFIDGGTLNLNDKFLTCFDDDSNKPLPRVCKSIYLHYALDGLLHRRETHRNATSSVPQLEGVHIVTEKANSTPVRPGSCCDGDSSGTVLGPLQSTVLDETWQLTFAQKRDLYGKDARPGCRTDGEASGQAKNNSDDETQRRQ